MTITSKSTKHEIYQAYLALQHQQQSQTITWPLVVNTARIVAKEARFLATDMHKAGTIAAQWISKTVDEMSKPVLRSI